MVYLISFQPQSDNVWSFAINYIFNSSVQDITAISVLEIYYANIFFSKYQFAQNF